MPAYFQPFLDRVRKQSDTPDPVSLGVPQLRRVSHSHGLSPTNDSGRRHSAPAFTFAQKDAQQRGPHQHIPPKHPITLWGRMTQSMGNGAKHPAPLPPLEELNRWSESTPIDATSLALVTRKYGEISAVASPSRSTSTSTSTTTTTNPSRNTLVLVAHKTQYCPPLDRLYALKLSRPSPKESPADHRARLEAQATLTSTFRHTHILTTFELLPLDATGSLQCLAMEYCAGGDLRTLIATAIASRNPRTFTEPNTDCLFKQLIRGLVYLHNRLGIAHRDLAPEHILITEKGCLKIAGFGRAIAVQQRESNGHSTGTGVKSIPSSQGKSGSASAYISPEQYSGEESDPDPRAADIWAAALIYVAMRTGGKRLWGEATRNDRRFAAYVEERAEGRDNEVLEELCNV
ncbi:kinase-like domain-containing protein [Aspergillus heterothallicus]